MKDPSSFRDSSGFIFKKNNKLYRVINNSYKKHYDHFMNSGLYEKLAENGFLVKHKESNDINKFNNCYKVLEVQKIPFISYPYEWSFSQFKESMLLTLKIQTICIEYNMTLKDSTPFNIQFLNNNPIFIDTLSFELIENENYVWKPYKQFCEMMLGPILLMKYIDPYLIKLLVSSVNGISLSLIRKLLPFKSKLNLSIFSHIILHSKLSEKTSKKTTKIKSLSTISKNKHLNLIHQLESFISSIQLPKINSEWGMYNLETINEKSGYVNHKKNVITSLLKGEKYKLVWDVGSNDGLFSRLIASNNAEELISFDIDWKCVNDNYIICKNQKISNVFPLLLDLSNPSPSIGWMNKERSSIFERFGKPELICCFALMHHIINAGIPLETFFDFLIKTTKHVLIEYVPLSDPKCQIIFESRGDDFVYPSQQNFEELILKKFNIKEKKKLNETDRYLYMLNLI